jgi:hypothetical protein
VDVWTFASFYVLTTGCSVKEPGPALLFLLGVALVLDSLELLLVEGLVAALCFETTTVVAIGGSIDVKESVHLTVALVLIVVQLRALTRLLELAGETVELSSRGVVVSRVVRNAGGGGSSCSGSFLCLLLFLGGLLGIVGVRVVAAVDSWVVTAPLTSRRRAGTRCARSCGQSGCDTYGVPVEITY